MNAEDTCQQLKFPEDRFLIGLLSIEAFQMWYASQDPRAMIFLGQDPQFKRFLFWNYTLRVRILRTLYKIKRFFVNAFSGVLHGQVIS